MGATLSDKLKNQLVNVKSTTRRLEESKAQKELYEVKVKKSEHLIGNMTASLEKYKQARLTVNKIQASKKKRDEESIKRSMELATELVPIGNTGIPYFKFTDGALPEATLVIPVGEYDLPVELIEGTGFNESTSLTTLTSVLSSTDFMKFLFLDEYFSSVSPENTENISKKLNDIFDGKIQVVIVEQKDEIVEHTSYREFFITYDSATKTSHVETYDVEKNGDRRRVE